MVRGRSNPTQGNAGRGPWGAAIAVLAVLATLSALAALSALALPTLAGAEVGSLERSSASGAATSAPDDAGDGGARDRGHGESKPLGDTAAGKAKLRRVILLGLRRPEQRLAQFVRRVSDPASSTYGQYLTIRTFRRGFDSTRRVRRRVMRFLGSRKGVLTAEMSATRTVVLARVRKGAARRLFCARGLRPPTKGLCLPRKLRNAVRQVSAGQLYSAGGSARSSAPAAGAAQRTGTPQGCKAGIDSGAFTPNQITAAYGVGELRARGLEGQGVRVAILSNGVMVKAAFATWAKCFDLPTPAFRRTSMPGAMDTSTGPDETLLDVEALSTLAPRLKRITAINVPLNLAFQNSLSLFLFGALDPDRQGGHLPDVLSISDGICEDRFTADQRGIAQHLLRAVASLGITAAAAAGDLGFLGCQEDGPAASWPASSRFVTAVGGTDITLDPQNRLTDQVVWSTFGVDPREGNGTGGGPSVLWSRPGWQRAPGIDASLQPGSPQRLTPDIASMASFTPGLAVFGGFGGWAPAGGTSAATPLVAAVLALVNEQERRAGRPALGAVNRLLYELARGPSYDSIFWDVVSGTSSQKPSSKAGKTPARGAAQPGYDLATGLGSLRGSAFADAVAAMREGPPG